MDDRAGLPSPLLHPHPLRLDLFPRRPPLCPQSTAMSPQALKLFPPATATVSSQPEMHVDALEPKPPLTREREREERYEERSDEGATREAHALVERALEMWEGMLCGRYVGMLCYAALPAPSSAPPI